MGKTWKDRAKSEPEKKRETISKRDDERRLKEEARRKAFQIEDYNDRFEAMRRKDK